MPIYEYLCQLCGKKFEVLQKFSDEPIRTHEECGGTVDKLISTSALQFKGSGWYVNDYAKGATGKPGETKAEVKSDASKPDGNKSDSGKSEGGGESKSESKTETKSETKPAPSESKPAASSSPAPASK
jgi:putative FmdB family regulatory protein